MHPDVDAYIQRSQRWPDEMRSLRAILLDCGLDEELKWGKPCYCHDGANIAIVQEMRSHLALMFFKGALLTDPHGLLHEQGPNSRSARRLEFTSIDDITTIALLIPAYIDEAIDIERNGLSVGPAPEPDLVDELQRRLDANPQLRSAFTALTPGRQREYHLYVSSAKQASTREKRIDKCADRILAGQGLRDR